MLFPWLNKSCWLLHVDLSIYIAIQKICINIGLVQFKVMCGCYRQYDTNRIHLCHRCKRIAKINAFNLSETLRTETRLVTRNASFRICIQLERPTTSNGFLCFGQLLELPCILRLDLLYLRFYSFHPFLTIHRLHNLIVS
jgi:hypothetical protein